YSPHHSTGSAEGRHRSGVPGVPGAPRSRGTPSPAEDHMEAREKGAVRGFASERELGSRPEHEGGQAHSFTEEKGAPLGRPPESNRPRGPPGDLRAGSRLRATGLATATGGAATGRVARALRSPGPLGPPAAAGSDAGTGASLRSGLPLEPVDAPSSRSAERGSPGNRARAHIGTGRPEPRRVQESEPHLH